MQLTPVNRTILKWETRLEYSPLLSIVLTLIEQLTILLIKGDRGSLPLVSPIVRRVNEKPLFRIILALTPLSFLLYFIDLYSFKKGEEHYKRKEFLEAARWGHAESLYRISRFYPNKQAFDLIVKAADRGSEKAYIAVAAHLIKKGFPLSSREGYKMLEEMDTCFSYRALDAFYKDKPQDRLRVLIKGMKKEDPECLFRLANVILRAEGINYNLNLIVKYLTQASDKGHAEATFQLAQMYVISEYGLNDLSKAIELLYKNYKRKHLPSTLRFIKYFLWTRNPFCDPKIIEEMLAWALSENCNIAYMLAAKCYESGIVYKKDINQALTYYLKAAQSNYEAAYYPLGKLYLELGNKSEAYKWLVLGGEIYPDGYYLAAEIEDNDEIIERLLQQAAKGNHPRALTLLGILGDEESLQKGFELNDPLAYMVMAIKKLEQGEDLHTAEHLLKSSYEKGEFEAAYFLGNLYRDQQKESLSIEYYRKGASHFDANATFEFAQLLIDGKGTLEDREKIPFWIDKARELNPDRDLRFFIDDQEIKDI